MAKLPRGGIDFGIKWRKVRECLLFGAWSGLGSWRMGGEALSFGRMKIAFEDGQPSKDDFYFVSLPICRRNLSILVVPAFLTYKMLLFSIHLVSKQKKRVLAVFASFHQNQYH
ncbi:hypothetical protein [Parasphingorhabdus litoris]|uniref:hypothetical protein n=1 Tax=Parasphingorhabdus litoris TaxID=394733 RepID=UPI001E2BF5E4|nr:hypothetical protein [Parasphingorhabdus litoris]